MHGGVRVLLIEDDSGHSLLVQRALCKTSSEFHVSWARTLAEAMELLRSDPFDVVLADLSLPDASDLEGVKQIRKLNAEVAIVVLTMLENPQIEQAALDCGAQDYLSKDLASPAILERSIHHAIQRQENEVSIKELVHSLHVSQAELKKQKQLLKRKNRRLRHLYRTAQRFVDNVSHEFRTPLTVIKDYVSLVQEGMFGPVNDEQHRLLEIASVRVDDLNNMVDDMLDVSKLEAGLLGAWRRICQFSEVTEFVAPSLKQKAAVRNIDLTIDVPDGLPNIYCDPEKIGRVIINLVVNAIKFSGDNSRVTLSARADCEAGEIVVSVSDNGPGMSPEDLDLIFKRFRRGSVSIQQSTKGFGLGLNIAHELTLLNFGRMHVDSELGRGSTFSFSIPLADSEVVLQRFAEQLRQKKKSLPAVTLVAVHSAPVGHERADDIDFFLSSMLRHNDLLWRETTHDWVIALAAGESEAVRFLDRMKQEQRQLERNRLGGPLPHFNTRAMGTWPTAHEEQELLAQWRNCLTSETAACP